MAGGDLRLNFLDRTAPGVEDGLCRFLGSGCGANTRRTVYHIAEIELCEMTIVISVGELTTELDLRVDL